MNQTKNIFTIIICFFAVTGLLSCKKSFLELQPKGKVIATSVADYDLLLNNLDLLNVSTETQVAMGDEVAAVDPFFKGAELKTQRLFRWDANIYEPGDNATEMSKPLQNIYLLNTIIEEVMQTTDGTAEQKKSLLAEAKAARAWTNFLLINYYGKPYAASTAASDPGFPIITKADIAQTVFTRASVKEVYDFIVNDLVAAIPDLPARTTHRLRMSKAAAEAVLGKVYVFMGKFSDALPYLNQAFTDLSNSVVPVQLYDYNTAFAPGGIFLPIDFFGPAYPNTDINNENIYAKQFINMWGFRYSELVMNAQAKALFNSSDHRLKFFSNTPLFGGAVYPDGMLRRMGPPAIQYGMVLPDLCLLRAECKARLNDLGGAKNDVEALRKKRMPVADAALTPAIANNQSALTKFILEERIREFALQGFRWFDMRRLSVDPEFNSTVNYIHTLYDQAGVTATFTCKPERLVLRFPQKVIDQNPGMQNNP